MVAFIQRGRRQGVPAHDASPRVGALVVDRQAVLDQLAGCPVVALLDGQDAGGKQRPRPLLRARPCVRELQYRNQPPAALRQVFTGLPRSEEHTSELQSPYDLVCRLLLEKKNKKILERLSALQHD